MNILLELQHLVSSGPVQMEYHNGEYSVILLSPPTGVLVGMGNTLEAAINAVLLLKYPERDTEDIPWGV